MGRNTLLNRLQGHIGSSEHCMEVSCYVVYIYIGGTRSTCKYSI